MTASRINIGLALLRPILCFEIILLHFYVVETTHSVWTESLLFIQPLAVGAFMALSFFFFAKHIKELDFQYLKKRILRIVIPILGWSIISYLIFTLLYGKQPIAALIWQLFTGHSYLNMPLWFMHILLLLTLVIISLSKISLKLLPFILLFFCVVAFWMQYSGTNFFNFEKLRFELKYPLGRICEMIPYAVAGVLIGVYAKSFLEKIRQRITFSIVLACCLFLLMIILKHYVFPLDNTQGFGNSGVCRFVLSIMLFLMFYILPNQYLSSSMQKMINRLTSYTLGIYCVHFFIGRSIIELLNKVGIEVNSFILCLSIYVISYLLCFLISKIPNKYCRLLVS